MQEMRQFGDCRMSEEFKTAPIPVGEPCNHCLEIITEEDYGIIYSNGPAAHYDCFMRDIIGSVAHLEKRCSCFVPGATCTDPPEMTRREAAMAAVKAWYGSNR